MATKTKIIINADKKVKDSAQRIAKKLGLPLSTIINAYLKQFIRDKNVNISLVEPREFNPEAVKLIKRASEDYRLGRNISPTFSSAEEMDEYLGLADI